MRFNKDLGGTSLLLLVAAGSAANSDDQPVTAASELVTNMSSLTKMTTAAEADLSKLSCATTASAGPNAMSQLQAVASAAAGELNAATPAGDKQTRAVAHANSHMSQWLGSASSKAKRVAENQRKVAEAVKRLQAGILGSNNSTIAVRGKSIRRALGMAKPSNGTSQVYTLNIDASIPGPGSGLPMEDQAQVCSAANELFQAAIKLSHTASSMQSATSSCSSSFKEPMAQELTRVATAFNNYAAQIAHVATSCRSSLTDAQHELMSYFGKAIQGYGGAGASKAARADQMHYEVNSPNQVPTSASTAHSPGSSTARPTKFPGKVARRSPQDIVTNPNYQGPGGFDDGWGYPDVAEGANGGAVEGGIARRSPQEFGPFGGDGYGDGCAPGANDGGVVGGVGRRSPQTIVTNPNYHGSDCGWGYPDGANDGGVVGGVGRRSPQTIVTNPNYHGSDCGWGYPDGANDGGVVGGVGRRSPQEFGPFGGDGYGDGCAPGANDGGVIGGVGRRSPQTIVTDPNYQGAGGLDDGLGYADGADDGAIDGGILSRSPQEGFGPYGGDGYGDGCYGDGTEGGVIGGVGRRSPQTIVTNPNYQFGQSCGLPDGVNGGFGGFDAIKSASKPSQTDDKAQILEGYKGAEAPDHLAAPDSSTSTASAAMSTSETHQARGKILAAPSTTATDGSDYGYGYGDFCPYDDDNGNGDGGANQQASPTTANSKRQFGGDGGFPPTRRELCDYICPSIMGDDGFGGDRNGDSAGHSKRANNAYVTPDMCLACCGNFGYDGGDDSVGANNATETLGNTAGGNAAPTNH